MTGSIGKEENIMKELEVDLHSRYKIKNLEEASYYSEPHHEQLREKLAEVRPASLPPDDYRSV